MKKYYFFFVLVVQAVYALGQEAVTSSGNIQSVNGTSLAWTLGQAVGATTSSAAIILSEGFHQTEVTQVTILSTSPATEQAVRIYPNPTTDFVTVDLSGTFSGGSMHLRSIEGKVVFTAEEGDFSRGQILDMQTHPTGVYLLTVVIRGAIQQYKIIKQ